jgi:hypothetical protein
MVAKLASIDSVRYRGGVSPSVGRGELIQLALEQATLQLSELLDTGFDAQVGRVDEFFFNVGTWDSNQTNFLRLLPTDAFHDENTNAIEVRVAGDIASLAAQTPLAATDLRKDNAKGLVTIVGLLTVDTYIQGLREGLPGRGYVSVTYDAGFATTTTAPYGDFYDGVPDWLSELCATLAWNRFVDMAGNPEGLTKIPVDYVQSVIQRNHRLNRNAVRPLR